MAAWNRGVAYLLFALWLLAFVGLLSLDDDTRIHLVLGALAFNTAADVALLRKAQLGKQGKGAGA